jgi:hypothetical protein
MAATGLRPGDLTRSIEDLVAEFCAGGKQTRADSADTGEQPAASIAASTATPAPSNTLHTDRAQSAL